MIKKITYIANDGKEFDNEYNCMTYEFNMKYKEIKNLLSFYDENGKSISADNVIELAQRATCIKICSKEAWDFLGKIADYCEFICPVDNYDYSFGIWYYSMNGWVKLDDIIKYYVNLED